MGIYILIGGLGLSTGFLSGLLGIGGGIVMAPLLLYVPPLFGFEPLPMRMVAGLTIVQGLLGCISGALSHRRFRFVSDRLCLYMGTSIFVTAMAGGAGSSYVSNEILLFLFAALALIASILMLISVKGDSENPDIESLTFHRWRAVTAASGVGLLGGLVGQGGLFLVLLNGDSQTGGPTHALEDFIWAIYPRYRRSYHWLQCLYVGEEHFTSRCPPY